MNEFKTIPSEPKERTRRSRDGKPFQFSLRTLLLLMTLATILLALANWLGLHRSIFYGWIACHLGIGTWLGLRVGLSMLNWQEDSKDFWRARSALMTSTFLYCITLTAGKFALDGVDAPLSSFSWDQTQVTAMMLIQHLVITEFILILGTCFFTMASSTIIAIFLGLLQVIAPHSWKGLQGNQLVAFGLGCLICGVALPFVIYSSDDSLSIFFYFVFLPIVFLGGVSPLLIAWGARRSNKGSLLNVSRETTRESEYDENT